VSVVRDQSEARDCQQPITTISVVAAYLNVFRTVVVFSFTFSL
jgi:hypothetical protein